MGDTIIHKVQRLADGYGGNIQLRCNFKCCNAAKLLIDGLLRYGLLNAGGVFNGIRVFIRLHKQILLAGCDLYLFFIKN